MSDTKVRYDKDGNVNPWWTDEDEKAFKERVKVCEEYFSKIKVLPDLNINGTLTLGENIADHGGVKIAYLAFQKATNYKGDDKKFFIAYALQWASNITDEMARFFTYNDTHSLDRWRVNGVLAHIDAWYEAFDIKPNSKLYVPKEKRFDIW